VTYAIWTSTQLLVELVSLHLFMAICDSIRSEFKSLFFFHIVLQCKKGTMQLERFGSQSGYAWKRDRCMKGSSGTERQTQR
jgi:hypothetical protein